MTERYKNGRTKGRSGGSRTRATRESGRAGAANFGALTWTVFLLGASIALAAAARFAHL